jgi:hypothetical protein
MSEAVICCEMLKMAVCLPSDLVQVNTRFSNHDLEVCNTSTVTYVFRAEQ